jgi:sugar phosphate isomerase/epimerase
MDQLTLDRFSLCHGTLASVPPPEFVSAAAAAGFKRVSLRIAAPRTDALAVDRSGQYQMLGDTPARRETRRRLLDTGLTIVEAEAALIRPRSKISSLEATAETAAVLGAAGVLCVFFEQADEGQISDQVSELCALFKPYNLKCLVEFLPSSALKSLVGAVRVCNRAGLDKAGVICDLLHLMRSNGSIAELRELSRGGIATAQINDATLEASNDTETLFAEAMSHRRFLGDGNFPVREFVDNLADDIPISLEVLSKEFLDRGWTADQMAQYCARNIVRYFNIRTVPDLEPS